MITKQQHTNMHSELKLESREEGKLQSLADKRQHQRQMQDWKLSSEPAAQARALIKKVNVVPCLIAHRTSGISNCKSLLEEGVINLVF